MSNETRVTPADIEANISSEHYFTAYDGAMNSSITPGVSGVYHDEVKVFPLALLTFCVLVLKNGFTVTGESACVYPANFDQDIGRRIAREHAINKIWPLMGYELKTKLSQRDD